MRTDLSRVEDAVFVALEMAREFIGGVGVIGYGIIEHRDELGRLKSPIQPFANRVTTAGDEYYARKAVAGIGTPNGAAPTAANGMKLGTGATAASKSGAGAALGSYISGSNVNFTHDPTFPQVSSAGTDAGWNATYKVTWDAGVATNAAITEAVLVNDAGTNATSTAANTYSRTLISSVNKAAGDTLAITWNHLFLGA